MTKKKEMYDQVYTHLQRCICKKNSFFIVRLNQLNRGAAIK